MKEVSFVWIVNILEKERYDSSRNESIQGEAAPL